MPKARTPVKRENDIHCMWALACRLSSVDQQKNNVSLFEIVDQLNLPAEVFGEVPTAISLPHEIVSQWRRLVSTKVDDRELIIDIAIEFVDPYGKILQRALAAHSLTEGKRRLRIRTGFPVIVVTHPGDYVYRMSYKLAHEEDFHSAGSIYMEVTQLPG